MILPHIRNLRYLQPFDLFFINLAGLRQRAVLLKASHFIEEAKPLDLIHDAMA
jgi:hypothetical protein